MVYGVYHRPYFAGLLQTAFKVPADLADGFYPVRMQYTDGTGTAVESSELADLIVRTGPSVAGIVPRLVPGEGSDGNPVADVPREFQGAASFSAASGALVTAFSSTYAGNFSVPVPSGATTATITLEGAPIEQGDSLFSNFGRIFPLPSDGSSVSFTIPMLQDFLDDSSPPNLISRQGMGYVVGTQPLSALDNLQVVAQNLQWAGMAANVTGHYGNVCIATPTGPQYFNNDHPQLYPGALRYYRADISARWATLPIPVDLNLDSASISDDLQAMMHAAVDAWNIGTVQFYTEASAPIAADGYGVNFVYSNNNEFDYSDDTSDGETCGASPVQGIVTVTLGTALESIGDGVAHELGHGLDQTHPPEGTLIMSPNADVAVVNTYVANGQKANRVLRVAEQYLYQLPLTMGTVNGTPINTNALSYANPGAHDYTLDPTYVMTGTIQVTTNLSIATFTISGPSGYTGSGTSWATTNAPVGAYTITFGAVSGYTTPASQTQTLSDGGSISFTGTYSAVSGGTIQ
jgi:hypothetical protein